MLFGVQRAAPGYFDQVATPFRLGAMQLDIGAAAAEPFPRRKWQVLHLRNSDIAKAGNVFRLHEYVIRRLHPAPFAEARAFPAGWLVPMDLVCDVVHVFFLIGYARVWATIAIAS